MSRHKVRPCPLCREEQPLAAQELCHKCTREVEDLRRFSPLVQAMADKGTYPYQMGERAYVPNSAHYVSVPHGEEGDSGGPGAQRFALAMRDFLFKVAPHSEVKPRRYPHALFSEHSGGGRYLNYKRDSHVNPMHAVELTNEAHSALHELYQAINQMLREERQDGQEHGQNLIQQLAAGEVTAGDFDEHLERIARERRCAEKDAEIRYQRRDPASG